MYVCRLFGEFRKLSNEAYSATMSIQHLLMGNGEAGGSWCNYFANIILAPKRALISFEVIMCVRRRLRMPVYITKHEEQTIRNTIFTLIGFIKIVSGIVLYWNWMCLNFLHHSITAFVRITELSIIYSFHSFSYKLQLADYPRLPKTE